MIHLAKAIKLLSLEARKDEGDREWIKSELPEPRPSRRWWNRTMREIRERFPEKDIYEISEEVSKRWYSMPEKDRINIRKNIKKENQEDNKEPVNVQKEPD